MSRRIMWSSLTLLLAVATMSLSACTGDDAPVATDDKPSASEWAAAVVEICTGLEDARMTAAAELPSDAAPTPEQLMAFYSAFTPEFASAVDEMKAVDRPEGLDTEIDEVEAAMDDVVAAWTKIPTDPAAAQAELAADGQTPETKRLEEASVAAGIEACNG